MSAFLFNTFALHPGSTLQPYGILNILAPPPPLISTTALVFLFWRPLPVDRLKNELSSEAPYAVWNWRFFYISAVKMGSWALHGTCSTTQSAARKKKKRDIPPSGANGCAHLEPTLFLQVVWRLVDDVTASTVL